MAVKIKYASVGVALNFLIKSQSVSLVMKRKYKNLNDRELRIGII